MSQKFLSDVVLTTLSSGILKVDADGKIVKAVAGTDYLVTGAIGALDDLSDVVISSPSADQILVYGQPLGGDPGVNVWYNKTPNYLTSYTETDPIYTASSWYTTTNNASNWDTAYGWGNHAGLYASTSHTHSVFTQATSEIVGGEEVVVAGENGFVPASGIDDGTKFLRGDGTWQVATTDLTGYATETWVTSQGYLTSYTETDPIFVASDAYNIRAADITTWNTAYGWGDHSEAGYITGNETITLSGDVSGSGTTSITVTVSDDSHNHTYSQVSGISDLNSVPNANNANFRPFVSNFQATNRSGSNYNGGFEVGTGAANYGAQFTFQASAATTAPYYRNKISGTWGSWYRLWGTADFSSTDITNWNTAYGWGNHATAGYITADDQELTWNGVTKELSIADGNTVTLEELVTAAEVEAYGYIVGESDTLATVTSRGASTTGRINVRGIGNQGGGNIMMGNTGNGTNKWSYLTGTHYNADTQTQGFSIIGGLSTDSYNAVIIGGSIYESNPATQIQFWTHTATTHNLGGTQRGVITSSGNWGIGTNSPSYRLDVNGGTSRITHAGWAGFEYHNTAGTWEVYIGTENNSGHARYNSRQGDHTWYANSSATMKLTSAGNLGIGTTSPSAKVHIVSAGSAALMFNRSGASTYGYEIGGTTFGVYDYTNSVYRWRASGNNVLLAESNGNVGIGTTSPGSKLHSKGEVRVDYNDTDGSTYITGYGVEFARGTNYLRPRGADGTQTLYVGGADDSLDWNRVNFKVSNEFSVRSGAADAFVIDSSGVVTLPQYGAGLLKTDANGVVSVDTATYVTADDQELTWEGSTKTLSIADGNSVTLTELVTAAEVEAYGYIIGESDTLNTVTGRGATTTNSISVGPNLNVGGGISTESAYLQLGNGRTANGYAYIDLVGDTTYTDYGLRILRNSTGANTSSQIVHRGTGNFYVGTNEAASLIFQTGASNRAAITSAGNMGIGNTAPGHKLDVTGTTRSTTFLSENATSSSGIYITSGAAAASGSVFRLNKGDAAKQVYQSFENDTLYLGVAASQTGVANIGTKGGVSLDFDTGYANRMRITSGGDVGIGTTSPYTKLHVYGDLSVGGDGSDAILRFIEGTNGWTIRHVAVGNRLAMSNVLGGTDHFNILETGEVGIGVTSPSQKLEVGGSIAASGSVHLTTSGAVTFYGNASLQHSISSTNVAGAGSDDIRINSYGAFLVNLDSNSNQTTAADFQVGRHGSTGTISDFLMTLSGETGNLGLGTTSPSYKMHVVGSMYASSGAIFGDRITVSGNVENDEDRVYDIGTDASRWRVVYCETLDSAGQHESNLANEEIQDLPTGTVLVWEDGKAVPCSSFANFMKIGVSVNGHNSPLVQGAEPVLCTGDVEEGDYLVTSEKIGHAVAMKRSQVKEEDLFDCVIGKALEAGSGNSHLVKTWINI